MVENLKYILSPQPKETRVNIQLIFQEKNWISRSVQVLHLLFGRGAKQFFVRIHPWYRYFIFYFNSANILFLRIRFLSTDIGSVVLRNFARTVHLGHFQV